ncbi:Inositol-1,4,5-trisphosphate 5-phosphatase 1 [Friedmanniomyces endolithicus]|nr:Inositol-1,4,5-trisphosphate 5-phosphatase 1 [Friedmanniomyces endolithicus]KAK0833793.1 Inositol-1,4,5-trisphosphate 5-phosphatase 1 [Friedmanniomyces endolithicus]
MKLFIRDQPRAIALATETHVLILRHNPSSADVSRNTSTTSIAEGGAPRCIVEFSPWEAQDMSSYRSLSSMKVHGTLGLVTTKSGDVFLCVVNGSSPAATVRPGETVQRIFSVEFHCLTKADYDHLLTDQANPFPADGLDGDAHEYGGHREPLLEHPCMEIKKLLSGGSFYYSADFDLTKRLQDRSTGGSTVAIESLDAGFLWNTFMIQPLVDFRSRLSERERDALDQSKILTSAIRGFAATVTVPASASPARMRAEGFPSHMTLISRLSCRRAGTRFNARGVDDDGNVANFVETETLFCTDSLCFSYVQCRGSVPIFWEQASGLPGQQKITITRSADATRPAFEKHFDALAQAYGDIFVVNLLSDEKSSEMQITQQYVQHINESSLNERVQGGDGKASEHMHLRHYNYDFHALTRGPNGYEAASGIRRWIESSAISFEFFLSQQMDQIIQKDGRKHSVVGSNVVLEQSGVFRTNCLDCLDRTNLVQTIISQLAVEIFLKQQNERSPTSDFWARHGTLWADCGDALSKIYAGTGALKSSFTRSGKMSLAGALADVRKSAQRLYINNFEDKGRQNTIDMLLGRLMGQMPVHLYDPINDWVTAELNRRVAEYSSTEQISIYVGTFNLNGKTAGPEDDLSLWLCPELIRSQPMPDIMAIAFQEIVNLDVQQIMSTDPHRRSAWEELVRQTLNTNARRRKSDEYVLLRGGQLVGASLSVFVRANVLPYIKNVEGAVKKTGMSGMAGNKGAVAIRMDYADTSLCLVTAHLAAGFANYEERNQDYKTISTGLRFNRERGIEDHNTVIWFGDFNYRIGMENDRARALVRKGDVATLYENDQLNLQMVHGRTFRFYTEMTPSFMPTYKYNLGNDEYDSSEKARIPAWTDRIVTKGDNLRQLVYDTAPLRFSDHRPVFGYFQCTVSVTEQGKKDHISSELYARRRATVGSHTASKGDESDDESLLGYDSVEPGLPPASSEKRKWWLDGGMPARSTVKPPTNGYTPNPSRPSNPFSPSSEPDWVKVDRPADMPAANRTARGNSTPPRFPVPRTTAPTPASTNTLISAPPPKPPRPMSTAGEEPESRVHLKQTLRKPAPPPKPNKPTLLRSSSSHSAASVSSSRSAAVPTPPAPPEPRRVLSKPPVAESLRQVSATAEQSSPRSSAIPPQPPPPRALRKAATASSAEAPGLPARRVTSGLMDSGGGEEEELSGWAPLVPK